MRILILGTLLLVAACGSDTSSGISEADRDATLEAMSALELMSVAFDGSPSPDDIAPPLLKAMGCFDFPDTEENRERAGNVLVVMRQDHGVSEMEILEEMSYFNCGLNMTFGEAAALAAVGLALEP